MISYHPFINQGIIILSVKFNNAIIITHLLYYISECQCVVVMQIWEIELSRLVK